HRSHLLHVLYVFVLTVPFSRFGRNIGSPFSYESHQTNNLSTINPQVKATKSRPSASQSISAVKRRTIAASLFVSHPSPRRTCLRYRFALNAPSFSAPHHQLPPLQQQTPSSTHTTHLQPHHHHDDPQPPARP
ncbi:hypothetical protein C7974DRAFT_423340, partial [Boeremia exigua]|uniref:uncharacterized protein n=1 Tax=Boeremia exigua TaxID=749465 RepID=UPI001E8D6A38